MRWSRMAPILDRWGVFLVVFLSFAGGLAAKFLISDFWGETVLLILSLLLAGSFFIFTIVYSVHRSAKED